MIRVTLARRANEGLLGIFIADEEGPEMSPKVIWRYLWLHAIVGLIVAGPSAFFLRLPLVAASRYG
jgi:hypothetical protein